MSFKYSYLKLVFNYTRKKTLKRDSNMLKL